MLDLKIITPNRNGAAFIASCFNKTLEDLRKSGLSFQFIVVDNRSTDKSREIIKQQFPEIKIVVPDTPLNFSASNNLGADHGDPAEYLLFLNSDAYPLQGSILTLVEFLKVNPKYSIAGPMQLKPDGSRVYLDRRMHTPLRTCIEEIAPKKIRSLYYKWIVNPHKENGRVQENNSEFVDVLWVSGFCLLIRTSSFHMTGKWDDKFPFYCEDMDLCRRVIKTMSRCALIPNSRFIHFVGGSTGGDKRTRERKGIEAQVRFFNKHYPKSSFILQRIFRFVEHMKLGKVNERLEWWNELYLAEN